MSYYISPSILSADLARLGEDVANVLAAGADGIHFDVMDNHYVPNLSFGAPLCSALRNYGITAPIDVHLMVEPVDDLIQAFIKAGASSITFHPEATKHIDRSMQLVKDAGLECGLALNPATPLTVLKSPSTVEKLDRVLVMSVNPGFGGQKFIHATYQKIFALKHWISQTGKPIKIEVDGGVKIDNIAHIAQAGATMFVAGSAIFGQPNYKDVICAMRKALATVKSG